MRGRRHKLQVSTFPFLAVLLCAMGSLILVLLVMDRKAHQAAQARARREAARLQEESAQNEAAHRAEWEQKRRQERAAKEEKRAAVHANLTREQIELQLQMKKVRDQLGEIAARLRYEQDTSTDLRRKIQDERGRLQADEQLVGHAARHGRTDRGAVEGVQQGSPANDDRPAADGAGAQGLEGRPPARATHLFRRALPRPARREPPAPLRRMHRRRRHLPPRAPSHAGPFARVSDRPRQSRGCAAGRRACRGRTPHRSPARQDGRHSRQRQRHAVSAVAGAARRRRHLLPVPGRPQGLDAGFRLRVHRRGLGARFPRRRRSDRRSAVDDRVPNAAFRRPRRAVRNRNQCSPHRTFAAARPDDGLLRRRYPGSPDP